MTKMNFEERVTVNEILKKKFSERKNSVLKAKEKTY